VAGRKPPGNAAQLSHLFGITETSVAELYRAGIIPPPTAGAYDVPKCIQAYIAHLRSTKFLGSADELGKIMGIGAPGVRKLVREQDMPREARGLFDFSKAVPWYLDKWKRKAQGEDRGELSDERMLLVREQRLRATMERQLAERTMCRRDEVEAGWITLAGVVVAAFASMVARLAPVVVNLETPAEARALLKREERNVREQLAAEIRSLSSGLRGAGSGDHRAAAGADPGPVG
jgi:hypothetical protein